MKKEVLRSVVDVAIDGNDVWILTSGLNGLLYKYNLIKKELESVYVYPKTVGVPSAPFSKMVKVEDEIYLIPLVAKDIFYYNITKNEFYKLNVPFNNFQNSKNIGVVVHNNCIYCVNRFPDAVMKIDLFSKNINVFRFNNNHLINTDIESKIYRFYMEPCLYQGEIIWSNYNDRLTFFDVQTESFRTEILDGVSHEKINRLQDVFEGKVEDWLVGVRAFDNKLWLLSYEGKIYIYDKGIATIQEDICNTILQYEDLDNSALRGSIIYDAVALKDELWFIPAYKNKCIKYNGSMQYKEALDDYVCNWDGYKRHYTMCKVINEQIILLFNSRYDNSYYEDCFYILDTAKNVVSKEFIEIPYAKLIANNPDFEKLVVEGSVHKFDDLEYLFDMMLKSDGKQTEMLPDNVGKDIYQSL